MLGESRAQLREQLREDLKAALTKNGITTPGADELLDLRLIATDPELKVRGRAQPLCVFAGNAGKRTNIH